MHELSIVASLFEIMEEKAQEKGSKKIISVKLQVGRLSGVVPELLFTAFDIFKKDTIANEAELEIEEIPVSQHLAEHPETAVFICHRFYDLNKLKASSAAVPSTPIEQGLREHVENLLA